MTTQTCANTSRGCSAIDMRCARLRMASQALEAARQLRPALVLADVMMPQLDGFGLLRAIREDSALCSTPVILVSARAGEESRVEGLQADADDYLVKPFTSPELLARVATHVKMAHLRRVTAEREERLRNEAELQRQKLHASQELLAQTSRLYRDLGERERESRMIVNSIPGLVATLTPTGEVEFVTEQVIAYCGQTLEELKQWGTNGTVHPDDLPRVIESYLQLDHVGRAIRDRAPYTAFRWRLSMVPGSRAPTSRFERKYRPLVRSAHRHRRPEVRRSAAGGEKRLARDGGVRVVLSRTSSSAVRAGR